MPKYNLVQSGPNIWPTFLFLKFLEHKNTTSSEKMLLFCKCFVFSFTFTTTLSSFLLAYEPLLISTLVAISSSLFLRRKGRRGVIIIMGKMKMVGYDCFFFGSLQELAKYTELLANPFTHGLPHYHMGSRLAAMFNRIS